MVAKLLRFLSICMMLLLNGQQAYSQSDIAIDQDTSINLLPHLQLWIPAKPVDFDQVLAADAAGKFKPQANPLAPVPRTDIWYKFRLNVQKPYNSHLVLNFHELLYSELEVYSPTEEGWERIHLTVDQPLSERPIKYRFFAVPLTVPPGVENIVYFRVHSLTRSFVAPQLETEAEFFSAAQKQTIISVSILGILVAMIFYMWTLSRIVLNPQKQFAFLGLLISSFLYVLVNDGHLTRLIVGSATFSGYFYIVTTGLLNLFNLLYCRYCLEIRKINLTLGRINDLAIVLVLISTAYALLFSFEATTTMVVRTTTVTLLMMVVCGGTALVAHRRGAAYYVAAISSYLGIVIYKELISSGVITYTQDFRVYAYIGSLSLTFFLSLSITRQVSVNLFRQTELERKAEEAEARDSSKSQFLLTLSHEIRSPINGVLGMAQLLSESRLDSTQRNYVEVLLSSAKGLQHVIDDILDLSRVDANNLQLEEVDFNLDQLLVYTIAGFQQNHKSQPIKFELEEIYPLPLYLKGDPTRLQQVINNLLTNTLNHTERGFITLSASCTSITETTATIKFVIRDTSSGLLNDDQKAFFNGEENPELDADLIIGGASLSLTICKRLIKLMNGSYGVISVPGKGNEFWFEVALKIDIKRQDAIEESTAKLSDTRIAIVFGNPLYSKGLVNYFTSNSISVAAIDYDTNLDEVDFKLIDLLLLSNSLGDHTSSWLKQAQIEGTEILLFNGLDNNVFSNSELRRLNVGVVNPPFGISQVLEIIERLISGTEADTSRIAPQTGDLSNLKILVAEDNPVSIKVIDAILRSQNITADFVTTGSDAVRLYEEASGHYDLILMDYQMPEMDGCSATSRIREFEHQQSLQPTIIYATTAYTTGDYKIRCMQAGMNGILTKPLQKALLLELLESVNTKHRDPMGN